MKAYLRSAFGLVRDNAFDFPVVAHRVEAGADLDHAIQQLSEEELDALHEHAFARYFERSGLFGTLEDGRRVAERAKTVGADEIACLIDFGVPFDAALESLDRLGELQASFVSTAPADDDFSLPALVARHGVTHLQCTPSRARILALDPASRAALGSLRRLFVGGEMLPSDLARELVELGPGEVWNMYGPTETTVWSACHRVEGTERSVPVGRPIANTVIRVVDERGRLAPIGSTGEVCIGGLGVTRGYFRRNDLSAQRFGVDPFAEDPRAKIYKTGDLGRWRADGRLELLGRSDHQVKIRGYRIELGEIETVLRAHPDVRAAVVAPWAPDAATPPFLVAYVVPSGGASFDEAGLRAHLRTELPAYMVPSRFVRMVALPLLPNGKLDRQGLPAPSEAGPAPSAPARPAPAQPPQPAPAKPGSAPQQANDVADPTPAPSADQVEAEIASVWKEVLGVEKVDRHQNFFDIGGHSLLVVQVHGRLKSQHPDLGITELFRFPTVGSLAEHLVARALAETGGPDSRAGSRRSALARRRAQRRRV
jgi:aryl carrier-like protein